MKKVKCENCKWYTDMELFVERNHQIVGVDRLCRIFNFWISEDEARASKCLGVPFDDIRKKFQL